ncbi:hypothetical protein RHOFW104T7_08905 [Rhodanobacter thiooxydans]|uniref:Uncharacterized protein n=1 Tax=Rhodanobacter thiooxydans TaxID=416169 RepID=A0A154QJN6_9GAMM|nr:hypothetical protein [Rhodanobacter thiooxydans]KZC24398.1 hypothetical protein RHOFW104T7_08905 [Rhodanobacter thiooxydans]MCW0200771.1 hypothetical protein [Rhodanobacter thiooxydans]
MSSGAAIGVWGGLDCKPPANCRSRNGPDVSTTGFYAGKKGDAPGAGIGTLNVNNLAVFLNAF